MAKIYGTPLMMGGGGGANKDLPPLLDNFKAFKGGGTKLKDLPSGSKVKLGKWNGTALKWKLARRAGDNQLRLLLEPDSMNLIGKMTYNVNQNDTDGYPDPAYYPNNIEKSDIQQWLNATGEAGTWYIQPEGTTLKPGYADSKPGFLNQWTNQEINSILNQEWLSVGMNNSIDQLQTNINYNSKITLLTNEHLYNNAYALDIFQVEQDQSVGEIYYVSDCWRVVFHANGIGVSGMSSSVAKAMNEPALIRPICAPNPEAVVSATTDDDGCYTIDYDAFYVTIQADKMAESRANELAGAVWVYGDHEPTSVNDGTKIQLTREECITPSLEGEDISVNRTIPWNKTKDFYARQFTYNSKKQYQTMLEGAIATIKLVGVPEPVSELAETHSGSSITLTWKNPVDDEFYNRTVVMYSAEGFPTSINEGTQGYSGTGETCTLEGLDLGNTYYISVFTVSEQDTHGEGEHVSVEIPAGQLLSSLASGTKVKLGKWNNTDLQWKVARDTTDQSLRLVLEPTSVKLLGNMQWDAAEPSNSDSNRRFYGNNRYIYSNIHQWLNATKAAGWYTAQHSTDAAPTYASSAGFLSGWSENHLNALDRPTLTVSRSSTDGGGTETFVSRVALMSTTELGLESGTGNGRLNIFNSDGDRATDSIYWTRTPYPSSSDNVWQVSTTGTLNVGNFGANCANGVRPLCSPKSTTLVSLEMDDDNCYVVQ